MQNICEELDDYEDLRCLREAKEEEKNAPTIALSELKKKLGIVITRGNQGK